VTGEPRSEQWWPEPWFTPLMWALTRGRSNVAKVLLAHGADASRRAPDGRSVLELVPAERRPEAEALLRDRRGV